MPVPVSVQIITLNEEEHIRGCLDAVIANDPAEIIVIDGGSTDNTVAIATSLGATVLSPGRLGRGASRHLGYTSTRQPFVAMVDADDRPGPTWLAQMLDHMEAGDYSALQSSLRAFNPGNFWSRGWDVYFQESIRPTSDSTMVGHPSIYRTDALIGARTDIGHEHEDTQLSMDFEQRGLRQGIAPVVSYRIAPNTREESIAKWRGYGRGYRDLVAIKPDKRSAILRHITWTIPVQRGFCPLVKGKWQQPVFALTMAGAITYGYMRPQR